MKSPPIDKLYYLATPYSSPDPFELERKYLETLKIDHMLMQMNYFAISPICMSHQQAQRFNTPGHWEYFRDRDLTIIDRCDGIIVGLIEGFTKSVGVLAELTYAMNKGKPCWLFVPPKGFSELSLEDVEGWKTLQT